MSSTSKQKLIRKANGAKETEIKRRIDGDRVVSKQKMTFSTNAKVVKVCNKNRHPSQLSAQQHLDVIVSRGKESADSLHTYFCEPCNSWHFGHKKTEALVR